MPTAGAGLHAIIWVALLARATSKGNSIAIFVSGNQGIASSNCKSKDSSPSLESGSGIEKWSPWPARTSSVHGQRVVSKKEPADGSAGSCDTRSSRSDPFRIRNGELARVRHLHLRQRLRIHYIVLANDFVDREDVGRQRVDLIVGQRLRRRVRHRASNDVEQGRRELVVGDGLGRIDLVELLDADHGPIAGRRLFALL